MSGQVRFGSRSRSGAGLGLRRGWLLSRRGVLQGAALSTREEGADSLGLLVPWSRVRLIAFVLALTSQATALQEGPPVISPSSQVEIQRWVNVEAVNLRSGPGVNHSVIQVLTVNNPVRVLGKAGRWVQVDRASGEDDAVTLNPVCQEELFNPGRDVSINPNENSILRFSSTSNGTVLEYIIPHYVAYCPT